MGATRPEAAEKCPDARRVAPISASVLSFIYDTGTSILKRWPDLQY